MMREKNVNNKIFFFAQLLASFALFLDDSHELQNSFKGGIVSYLLPIISATSLIIHPHIQ